MDSGIFYLTFDFRVEKSIGLEKVNWKDTI